MKFILFLLPLFANAQTHRLESVIVGSKRVVDQDKFTTDVESITEFSHSGNEKVLDSLESLPGVSINQSGAPGQQASIRIRGSEDRHVLVLIDGIRVNDPSSIGKSFNAALLNVGDIEKIEVLKGAQTLLYGSEAIAGVVNIITKKNNPKNYVSINGGYSNGIQLDNTFIAGNSIIHTHLFHDKASGISAAESGDEKDGYENKGATLNFYHSFNDKLQGDWTYKVMDQFVETDSVNFTTGVPEDARGDYAKSIQQIFSQKLSFTHKSDKFSYLLGMNKMDRFSKSSGTIFGYSATEYTNELTWNRKLSDGSLLIGLENLSETFSQDGIDEKYAALTSAVVVRDYDYGSWFGQYGIRTSFHTEYEDAFSPSVGVGKYFGEHRFSINLQKGFKAPSLYQLYAPAIGALKIGNNELRPESSESVDLNYNFKKLVELSLFFTHISDVIEFGDGYENADWLESYGVELNSELSLGSYTLRPGIFLANFTTADGNKALRRPSQKASVGILKDFKNNQSLRVDYVWSGKSYDRVNGIEKELSPYSVVDIHYEKITGDIIYNLGVENALDEEYNEVFGYSSQPVTFYGRLKYSY
ncbi:MAG: TonB-dependent receptor [Bacteriovoracaceae bacterium]|nr:TonB-dependent receptor [Bacteriovoracaceae bacterium]